MTSTKIMMEAHKIRRADGLFSKGGSDCTKYQSSWSKKGKTWSSMGPLVSHLNQYSTIPTEWEVVSFYVDEDGNSSTEYKSAVIIAAEAAKRREKRNIAKQKSSAIRERNELSAHIERLQKKLQSL